MAQSRNASLVRRTLAGDTSGFGQLVEDHQRAIYALLLARVRDYEVARDLVQETFVQAFLGLARLSQPDRFLPWLYGIARNLANDHLRRRKDFVTLDDAVCAEDPGLIIPPPDAEKTLMRRRLLEAIGRLPEKSREAVLLFYGGEYRYKEIAAMLSVSIPVVRSRLEYGRNRLKKELLTMVTETLREQSPGPEFKGKVLEHVCGIKAISPCLSSLAAVLRYRVRQINEHITTRALTDELLAVTAGDAFRFYYGTDPSVRFLCSHNLLVTACEAFGLSYAWRYGGSFEASWKIMRAAIDDGTPALVAYRPQEADSNRRWIPLDAYATWGLVVGYDEKTKAVVLAPAGRFSTVRATEIVDDFAERWGGWAPGPEGWVKYPVFVPGEPAPRPTPPPTGARRVSLFDRAIAMLTEGPVSLGGKDVVGGVAGLETWAGVLRDGRVYDEADGPSLDALAAATLEMVWLLRPSRRTAATHLFTQSARYQDEVRGLLRQVAGLYLDVSEPLAIELEEVLTETPEIRDVPDHAVSHLEVARTLLRDPGARARGAEIIKQIAGKEREALRCLSQITALIGRSD
jgi:RNA polymerase sigma-70 factor (ECF subfamily)